MGKALCVGVGGPVGSGKTALVQQLVPRLLAAGRRPSIVANDIYTTEDASALRSSLAGVIEAGRIVGVETGGCPHAAVRDDPTANLEAVAQLMNDWPDTDIVLIESGGDNLTLTFSPLLADCSIYVLDVAGGDKMPKKQGPGLVHADLLVINKADLAPYVGADLARMETDARAVRTGPLLFTDCRTGAGIEPVAAWVNEQALLAPNDAIARSS
ncbi:MAG TPA: urease accessory protein UreG [Dehalococcoidia bacterium]|nr:urease accessory protein UreG [Dehalococcoidia bacterium]